MVAAVPAERPLREISLYDLERLDVTRLVDPDPDAEYGRLPGELALSRDGKTLYAIRSYFSGLRRPDLVAIELATGELRVLPTQAFSLGPLTTSEADNELVYLRDVDDRVTEAPSRDQTGRPVFLGWIPQPFLQLATYDPQLGRERVLDERLFRNPARLKSFRGAAAVWAEALHPPVTDADPGGKGHLAILRYSTRYDGPGATPSNYSPYDQFVFLAPLTPGSGDAARLSQADVAADIKVDCTSAKSRCPSGEEATRQLGFRPAASDTAFATGDHQFSDDGAVYAQLTRDLLCWGSVRKTITCRPHDLESVSSHWRAAMLSHDGRALIVGENSEADGPGRLNWCRLTSNAPLSECKWHPEQSFSEHSINLIPASQERTAGALQTLSTARSAASGPPSP